MNNKKILSIITLAGVIGMNTQSIAENTAQGNNTILLANRSVSSNIQEKEDLNIYNIEDNVITINNVWRQNIGSLKFNSSTNKIEFVKGGAEVNPYLSSSDEAFSISLYKSNGELIKSIQVNGGEYPESELYNAFNNLDFSYGDTLTINYKTSSKLNISNFDNEKNYNVNKSISVELTKGGLKKLSNNLTVNPIYFDLGSNKINVSGKATANSIVNIWIDGKDYTTTSNSNGEYNLNINPSKKITPDTVVKVFNQGNTEVQKNVELNPDNYKLNYTSISLNGYWGGNPYLVSKISFNQYTKKLELNNLGNVYFSWSSGSPAYTITLLNKNGEIIKSKSYNGSGCSKNVYDDFNGLSFEYGDSIQIKSHGLDMSINNPNGKIDNIPRNGTKTIDYEITQDGLKMVSNNLTVNPVYFELGSNKINVSGKTTANTLVNIWVDNKDYTTTSNSNGEYNLNINADKSITSSTKIKVFVAGEEEQVLNATLDSNIYKIVKNNITLVGNWDGGLYKAANISFNPESMKLNITGSMGDYFGSGSGNAFEISLYSKNGDLIKTKTYVDSKQTKNLYNDFNNLGFSYGDIIKVACLGSGQVKISNYDGESSYQVNKSAQMRITQDGLKPCNLTQIKVNPFDVLGSGKVTSGVLTGTITKANQVVNVIIDGKTFSGKSNNKGNFEIKVSDASGFSSTTNILVETAGQLATRINPTADSNLGILKSNILVHGEDGVIAQEVSFNPATMTVVKSAPWGNNFAAQLINGKTGAVIASCGTSDFNAYTSKNNLNGAHFEYGDIIAVYETEEMRLTNGSLLLLNGKTGIDCVDCFKCFRITPNGLVPVENKNLTTSQILYTGSKNLSLTGKTLPNTNVTVSYGDITKVVKSNSNGEFSLEIPFSDTQIGKEVRIFVNSYNNEALIVKYDSKLININTNRIEVLNNTNLPIFNVSFNPLNNKLNAVAYPGGMTYTGAFFEDALKIKLINPKNGNIIYSFDGDKLNNISNFIANINDKAYNLGDIIEVSYNPEFVKANVYDGKKMIGNTNGSSEYFEITNKGLVNLNDKFINVKPLDILNSNKVTSTNIEGKAKPNTSVEVSVDGNIFKGMTNGDGNFNISISDKNGFTSSTNIVVSSEGYIPTHINPKIESNIGVQNSYINFYNSKGSYGQISSSITFNPMTMKFVVDNYTNSFGDGKSHYFTFDLYSSNGEKLLSTSINNGATSAVAESINNKSFNYGDIIGLSYNNSISKPAILNGNTVLGNISGKEEYFKITKTGLVPVKFGQSAYTSNVSWNNNNLVIDSNLAHGQSESILKADKKLVILDSNNKIVDSVNTSILNNDNSDVQAVVPESVLDKLNKGEVYTFALDINNELFPIKVASNTPSNSKYLLEGNTENNLSIVTATEPVITINNSSDIANYLNTLNSNIKSQVNTNINSNTMGNSKLNYEITTREFITRVGLSNLENFFNKSEANKEFINWVLNNNTAMQEYLEGTNPKININGLQIWSDIWNKYTNSRSGFNLKLAIATAISNATPINAWPCSGTVGSPIERYNIFETLNAEGGMLPIFETLDVRHIECVVNTILPNDQIMEMRSIIMQNHNGYISADANGLNNIAYTIDYEEHNPHTGASIFGPDFYGKNPTVLDVWYDGGVCGSISRLGSIACQVFGAPAQPVGQPGHCAFIFYNNEHKWSIGNNIYGWSQSNGGDVLGWSHGIATNSNVTNYDLLYENINPEILKKSNEYLWLANSDLSYQDKMNAINEALKIEPLNVRAWLAKIDLMKTNHNLTVQDYINLSDQIINALKDYPMPMYDVLLQIKNIILENGTSKEYDNYVKSIDNALNSVTNSNQKPTAKEVLQLMPQEGLQGGATPLVNSKIIINNVWNQSLGTLGFNTVSMKMNVNKGWSEVNPYLNGEAFSIGLYNKDNKLIKSITLKGREIPENAIYNAFNNLGFNYGDKIFIDYKTSSKISASYLYKDGILDNSYNVNKSSVFELTPRGLVYLGDNLQNSSENATLKVSTVYPDGKVVTGDKYNYTETGLVGDSIKNEAIPALENYHIDYVTVNGVKTQINQLPKYYLANNMDIVYHMTSDSKYKLDINVKTEGGKVLNTMPVASYAKGDKISVDDSNWNKKEYKLDYILVDGIKTPADKLPEVMPDKNLNITYIVSPIAKSTITVETMVDGKVLDKPVVTTNYEGEAYKEVAPVWDNNDYELKDITVNGVKTSEADLPKVFGDKDITIVYNLSPKMMTVGERVVNQNGDVLYHNEYKLPFNTSIVNIEDKIPSNYKLENITVSNPNNKDLMLIANKDLNTYTNSNDVKVAFNGEVVSYNVVPINGEITYETQIGNEEPTNVVKEVGQVDTKSKEYKLDIPKGYEIESITMNGKKVDSVNDLDYKNEKQVVVYHLVKIPSTKPVVKPNEQNNNDKPAVNHNDENKPSTDKNDSKPVVNPEEHHETGNTDNKPVVDHNAQNKQNTYKHEGTKVTPVKVEHGEVIVKVIDQNGKVIEQATHTGVIGAKFNPIVIPSNDKLVNVTVNGKIVSENNIKNEIVSDSDTNNKTTIIYNVEVPEHEAQKAKPVVTGKVIIKVVDQNGKVIENAEHEGAIGTKFNPIQIPNNDKVINVTVDGTKVDNVPDVIEENSNNNTTTIIYNVNVPENKDNTNGSSVNSNDKTHRSGITNNDKNNSTNTDNNNTKPVATHNENNPSDSNKKNVTQDGNVKIEVIADNGRVVYSSNSKEAVGSKIESVNIPSGYHIDNVTATINNESVNEVPTKVVKGDIVIIYHVSKVKKANPEPAKVENGTLKIEIITNNGKVLSDSSYTEPVGSNINTVNIPNGYKLQSVSATINGNRVQEVPTKVVKGETTIVYNVVADQSVVNHIDNNNDKHSDTKPVLNHIDNNNDKHSDANPVVNHNENNTDKHSNVKPVVNHNDDNTDKHSDAKQVVDHNDNNTDKHSDVKPVVNHNDDNHSNVNPVENHNSDSESLNKGNSGETVIKTGLPDTGLNNTENDLGLLAGIMAAIAAIGIFRRKK